MADLLEEYADNVTAVEAGKILGLSRSTILSLIKAGKLKAYRLGVGLGEMRITKQAIRDYLASCEVKA